MQSTSASDMYVKLLARLEGMKTVGLALFHMARQLESSGDGEKAKIFYRRAILQGLMVQSLRGAEGEDSL